MVLKDEHKELLLRIDELEKELQEAKNAIHLLKHSNQNLNEKYNEARKHELEFKDIATSLGRRLKELSFFEKLGQLRSKYSSVNQILAEAVKYIPTVFDHPLFVQAQIILNNETFQTPDYNEYKWKLDTDLGYEGRSIGRISVVYTLGVPTQPFTESEKKHFYSISNYISETINAINTHLRLKENNRLYNLTTNAANLGIWDWKVSGDQVYYSDVWKSQLGYQKDELDNVYQTWSGLLHSEDRERCQNAVANYLSNPKGNFILEFRLKHKDNSYRWIKNEAASEYDDQGNVTRMYGVHMDITESKLAQQKIEQVSKDLEVVFNSMPFGTVIVNKKKQVVSCNNLALEMTGFKAHELIGSYCFETYCNAGCHQCPVIDLGQHVDKSEQSLLTKSKQKIPILKSVVPLQINNEELLLETFVDISGMKEAEKALQESEAFHRTIFKSVTDTVILVSFDGKIFDVNPKGCETYGYSRSEMLGMDVNDLIHPPDRYKFKKLITSISKGLPYNTEITDVRKNGELFTSEIKGTKVTIGQKDYAMGVVRDISERKAFEKELIKARKKAESESIHKNYFLANMSHEIRTPMNGIIGFTDLLKKAKLSKAERSRYLEIIDNNSKQLLGLIDDIIDVAKIEAGELKILNENCNIDKLLQELLDLFEQLKIYRNKHDLKFQLITPKEQRAGTIKTDSLRLRQVLVNLLGNSLKFTSKGTIKFGYQFVNGNLQFFVSDEGIGIPEDKLDEIFERFKQASYEKSVKYGGTGLGLAICKGILNLLGGQIWVESKLHNGSTFRFTLPYETTEVSKKLIIKNKRFSKKKFSGKTVLVAEDDDTNQEYLKALLIPMDINLLVVENGKKAIEMVQTQEDIDLVLLDIRMPVLNGLEALKQMTEINPNLPVIMQTAYAMANEKEICYNNGCKDYLTKPINKEKLFESMDKWIS